MRAFKDEMARKTAGKYIESMRGNFWTSAQKNGESHLFWNSHAWAGLGTTRKCNVQGSQ